MSRSNPTTIAKRNRERAQKEKQEIKRAIKAQRREEKKQRQIGGAPTVVALPEVGPDHPTVKSVNRPSSV